MKEQLDSSRYSFTHLLKIGSNLGIWGTYSHIRDYERKHGIAILDAIRDYANKYGDKSSG